MIKNHIVQIGVNVRDRATDPLKRISREVTRMTGGLRGVSSSIGTFNSTIDRMTRGLDRLANSMYRFNMHHSSLMRNMRNMGTIGAIGGAALAIDSAAKSARFEYDMAKSAARMGLNTTGTRIAQREISDFILNDLNYRVRANPQDLSSMAITLSQGGISNIKDMKSMLETVSFFSETTDMDHSEAAKAIISSVRGFDIAMENSSHVADVFSRALTSSLLEVEELPHAMGQLAGRAKMYGQTLESSVAALMIARNQGLPAAQAAQNLLHGLGQVSIGGRLDILWPMRRSYFEELGIDDSFFDREKKQLAEFPQIIRALENSLYNQGWMPDRETFYKMIEENGGQVPDGLIDKMNAMPIFSRVFGRAGMTPLIMGLSARHEVVDPNTGEKTGEVLVGADAVEYITNMLKNSTGATKEMHAVMEDTAWFQIGRLGGAWDATKIRFAENILPSIRVAADELSEFLNPESDRAGGIKAFNRAIEESANNLRQTNPLLGDMYEMMGKIASGGTQVSTALIPTASQFTRAGMDNIVGAEWGSSIFTLPFYGAKNTLGFIRDVTARNKESNEAIAALPEELQNNAKFIRSVTQGGLVLLATGAIIKIIELAIRGVSTAAKAAGLAGRLTKAIIDSIGGDPKQAGKAVKDAVGKTMGINANIVNVYGKAINSLDGPDGPDGSGGKNKKRAPSVVGAPSKGFLGRTIGGAKNIIGGGLATGAGVALGAGTIVVGGIQFSRSKQEEANKRKELMNDSLLKANREALQPIIDQMKQERIETTAELGRTFKETNNQFMQELRSGFDKSNSVLTSGLDKTTRAIENIQFSVNVAPPVVNLHGDLKSQLQNIKTNTVVQPQHSFIMMQQMMNRRFDRR